MPPSRTQPSQLRCSVCSQGFSRQEHLTRHMRIHTQEKPYQCPHCEKRFSRPDVLSRHTASHEVYEDRPVAAASSRACKQCAIDRARCSRGQPCRRCLERRRLCQYPAIRRTRTLAQSAGEDEQLQQAGAVSDELRDRQVPAGFDSQPTHAVDDHNPSAAFECTMDSAAGDSLTWMNNVDGIESLYDFGQPGLGVSGVNWMSPQDQQTVDWDMLMAGFPVNHSLNGIQNEMHGDGGRSGEESAAIAATNHQTRADQQVEQQLQTELATDAIQSHSVVNSAISSHSTEGRYYVDGAGARAPFGGRSHNRHLVGGIEALHEADYNQAASPQSPEFPIAQSLCSTEAYNVLIQAVTAENQIHSPNIDVTRFPSLPQLQLYVRYYFENFHTIFPFLRKSSFADDVSQEWLLLLAVAVVGSRYMRRIQGRELCETLFHLLNTTLRRRRYGYGFDCDNRDDSSFVPGQRQEASISPSLQILQAGILNILCMLHSGKKILMERAFVERHYLVEACYSLRLISESPEDSIQGSVTAHSKDEFIHKWLTRESRIRTGMMIWFLDSMFLYEFDAKPMMQLDDIKSVLPSHDDVWENPDLLQQNQKSVSYITLLGAMETIYMEKRLPPHLGEFSISLLVNAIYRNTKQIMAREQIRLNSWIPTAMTQQRSELPSAQQSWLPTTLKTSKWRNSACDCLDVLHWPANSKAARLLGSEHHTILQLHLARIIILTPTTYIQTFATGSATAHQYSNGSQGDRKYATARHQVLQWVVRDRFKARLSIIHCGALYWHVRRYSCDSVLEPYAIYMATLVLWAFSVLTQLPEVIEVTAKDRDDEPDPSFLHLDRPLDDELVQTFVRLGHMMSAYISKVGNIRDSRAPSRILQEGISLLTREFNIPSSSERSEVRSPEALCYTWGIEESFIESLRNIAYATGDHTRAGMP